MPTLYSFGNAANVSSNNFTTLYNTGAGIVNPQVAYGNANVESFLAVGSDTGGNTVGNIISSGNITAHYFFGNVVGNIVGNLVAPGANTEVLFNNNGNVGASANLTFNGAVLSVGGNAAANYFIGNGSQLTGLPAGYSNAQVASYLSSGNVTSNIITTGNVTGAFILGNGSQLTGLPAGYSNAQVASYLSSGNVTSNIITTGNVTGSFFFGNGSQLTGIASDYGNANVANFLANFGSNTISTTGNITANNISTVGNITVSGSLNSDDITSAGVTVYGDQIITGNLTVQGTTTTINSNVVTTNDKTITVANNQSTAANVNGAGIEAGNPAVATWLYNALTNSWQSNVSITPVGNLTQVLGNNQNRWSTVYAGAVDAAGNVSAVGNVTGAFILGNGSQLTGLPAGYSNAQVASYLSSGTVTSNIITTANVQGGNLIGAVWTNSITGTVAAGNIDIAPDGAGHVNLNADTVRIGDNNQDAVLATRGSGNLTIKPHEGDANQSLINIVNGVNGNIELTNNGTGNVNTARISASGNITAAYYFGNGSQLTGITSDYGNANVAANLAAFGNNPISTTGNITGGNVLGGNLISSGILSATGKINSLDTITGGNLVTPGLISASGNIATTANVSGAFILGNGSQLTGLPAGYSNAQVASYLSSGTVTSNIITTGNVTGAFILGNGSQLTGITGTYSNANVASFLAVYGANIISATGNITTTGNISAGYLATTANADIGGSLSVAGGITAIGSLIRAGVVSASGNIVSGSGGYFVGDGRFLTNLVIGTQSSLSVTGNTITGNLSTAGLITATGNITSAGTISAADIAGANTLSVGGNITAGENIFLTGQIISGSANLNFMYSQSVISAVGNITGGNIRTAGLISATGNVTGAYFIGNGSQLTGVTGTYGNANVATYLASGTNTSNIITTGNATVANLITTGTGAVVTTSVQTGYLTANAASGTTLLVTANAVVGNLSTAGNVAAGFFIGNGSQLTGITGTYGNANVATYLASGTNTANIITTGNISGGNLDITANISAGNLTTTGTGAVRTTSVIAGYLTANAASGTTLNVTANAVVGNLSTAGNVTAGFFLGNGSQLTGITGTYGNANVATYLASGTNTANIISTGNITGGNVLTGGAVSATGTVTGSSLLGSVVSASANITGGNLVTGGVVSATGNITAVANIAGGNILTVGLISATGNITSAANISGSFILGNGAFLTGIASSSYGNANVAANLAAFGSNPISSTGNITTTANISGSFFLGNGSQLTGITASLPANVTANVFTSQVYSYGNATGTITPDISLGSIQTMTLTGNITLNALSNVASGQSATFIINQDATGNRLLTSTWKFASNVRTLSTAANATDMISVTYIGTTYYASLIRGFA